MVTDLVQSDHNKASGGKAEIEYVTDWAIFYVFNFSSATWSRFWNVYAF